MKSRGALTWFSLDCCIHTSPKIVKLSDALGLDLDTTVGKLCRLYAWAKSSGNVNGFIGMIPADEIAGIMRYKGKAKKLVDALLDSGLMDSSEAGMTIHGWYEANGKSTEKSARDSARHRE